MPKQFFILPRYVAAQLKPLDRGYGKTAMIRISSDPLDVHDHQDQFVGTVELGFDDISDTWYDEYVKGLGNTAPKVRPINTEDAEAIVKFALEHRDVDTFIVHCDAGVSRSSGVMLALCETVFRELDCARDIIESGRFMPNSTVVSFIYKAYERITGNKITYG